MFATPRMSRESTTLGERKSDAKGHESCDCFDDVSRVGQSMGPESRLAVAKGWGVAADPAERRPRLGARPHGAGAVRGRRKRPHTRRGPASPPHAPPGHAPEGRRRWPRSPAPRDRLPAREDPSSRRGCRSHTPVASCRPPPCSWLPRVLAGDPPCPHPPTSVDAAEASAGALPGRVLVRGPTGAQPRASLRGRRPGGHLSGVEDRAGTCGHWLTESGRR